MSRALALTALSVAALALLAGFSPSGAPHESLEVTSVSQKALNVAASGGSPNAPERVTVSPSAATDGAAPALLDLSLERAGLDPRVRATVAGPDDETYTVGGAMLLTGDPAAAALKVQVMQGTVEQLSAHITRTGELPRVHLWINGTPEKHSFVLESPLRYKMDAKGALESLAVVDPLGSDEQLRLDRTPTGYRLETGYASREIRSDAAPVEEDGRGRLTIRVRDAQGAAVQTITIDRASQPARVTLSGAVDETHAGPVSLAGNLTSPKRLSVYDGNGSALLEYSAGSGAARLDIAGEPVVEDATLVRIDGDPLSESFTLTLRSDATGHVHQATVDRSLLEKNAPETVVVLSPLAGASEGMRPSVQLNAIRDARLTGLSELVLKNGGGFLAREGEHVAYLTTNASDAWFERIVLDVRAEGGALEVPFAPETPFAGTQTWSARYVMPAARDGSTVTAQVFFEKRLAPIAVQRYTDDHAYTYRVDGTAPTATLHAPATATDFRFELSWSGQDALTGVSGFELQVLQPGETQWRSYIQRTAATSATFSGDWDKTYRFRLRALDGVGNPSAWSEAAVVVAKPPTGSDDVNDPPTVRLLSPRAGDTARDLVEVRWDASDPDGTPVIVNVQLSADDGVTWRTLYSGSEGSVLWNTNLEPNGAQYRLRLTASDGTLTSVDASGAFTVLNQLMAAASPPAGSGGTSPSPGADGGSAADGASGSGQDVVPPPGASPQADAAEEKSGIPGPGVLVSLAGLGAAAYAFRASRRSR